MKVEHRIEKDCAIIKINGNINLYELHYIKDIFEIIQGIDLNRIILDLNDVEFIDSSGIGLLIVQANKARERKQLFILSNLSRSVDQVLRIASFKKLFLKTDSLEQAMTITDEEEK
ncbi:MAG: STAS domain-containing protein [Leptospiraceae bacterium]|nr:STAS domain-containing protein [Leptospiraceae bacterium]